MELRKKLLSVAALAFAAALSTGVAVSAGAEDEQILKSFAITHVAVRTEGTEEKPDAMGIRFKTTVGVNGENTAKTTYENADCYTNVSFTSDAEGEEKAYSKNVAADLWRAKGDGWNTVVLGMTENDYATEITAKSYIKVSETEIHETAAKTMSVEEAAARAMQSGDKAEMLAEYTKNAVTEITLDQATATIQAGETVTLTATTDAKYGVAWFSSDTTVAVVDKNGKVWGVSAGEATITAKMGNVETTCVVTVSARDFYDFETDGQFAIQYNFLGCGPSGTDTTTWEIAEDVGTEGNSALKKTDDRWSRGMQLRMRTSFLNKAFETADYLSLDVYTDATPLEYMDWANGSQGGVDFNKGTVTGVDAGTIDGVSVKKYSVVVMKETFTAEFDGTETETSDLRFMFTKPDPTVWYIDNFKFGSLYAPLYDFETSIEEKFADNLKSCGKRSTDTVENAWGIVENIGEEGNSALNVYSSNQNSRQSGLRIYTSYLNKVFETADYISFEVYTDMIDLEWCQLDANGGENQVLFGKSGYSNVIKGVAAGTYNGLSLYKYTFAVSKTAYQAAINDSAEYVQITLGWQNKVTVDGKETQPQPKCMFLDNFNAAGKYDAATIEIANSQYAGAIWAPSWEPLGSRSEFLSVVERTDGNYALKGTTSSSGNFGFAFNVEYLQYVFETLGATSIEFSIYSDNELSGYNLGANRMGVDGSKNATGITSTLAESKKQVNVTIIKGAYDQWKSSAKGYIDFWGRANVNETFYVGDFKINK